MPRIYLPNSQLGLSTDHVISDHWSINPSKELTVEIELTNQKQRLIMGSDAEQLWKALYPDLPQPDKLAVSGS